MSQGPRVLDRSAISCAGRVDLDSQLPPEHQARLVWSYVSGMELRASTRGSGPATMPRAGRPAVLLAVWLYATLEGIGVARAIARLCEDHSAYRWLCGGVPVNDDLLSSFRRESGAVLDGLLTQSLTGLIAEGLVTVEEVIIDGTKTQARAGRGSLAQDERLTRIEARVAEHVARLRRELAADPAGAERRRQERALRAAEEQEVRLRRARAKLGELEAEKHERAKSHAKAEAAKSAPRCRRRIRRTLDEDGGQRDTAGVERSGGDRARLRGDDRADRSAQ